MGIATGVEIELRLTLPLGIAAKIQNPKTAAARGYANVPPPYGFISSDRAPYVPLTFTRLEAQKQTTYAENKAQVQR